MSDSIMTRRRTRDLSSNRQEPAAKRTRTDEIESQQEQPAARGSELLTRQRRKVLENVTQDDSLMKGSSVGSRRTRQSIEATVVGTSEELSFLSEESGRYEQPRRQRRRRSSGTGTVRDKHKNQEATEQAECRKDEVSCLETDLTAEDPDEQAMSVHPKRQRRKTMKGRELESMLRRSSVQSSSTSSSDSQSMSADSAEKPQMEEPALKTETRQAESSSGSSHQSSDSDSDSTDSDSDDRSLWQVFEAVLECQTRDGRSVSEPFLKLPSKKEYPDYYDVITTPLSLNQIKDRIKAERYENVSQLCEELSVVFTNAQTYNEPNSQIYRDARRLMQVMKKKKHELCEDEETQIVLLPEGQSDERITCSKISSNDISQSDIADTPQQDTSKDDVQGKLKQRLLSLFETVLQQKDASDRQLCELFQSLPSVEDYPDYYDIIKRPIDLRMIRDKIENHQYSGEAHCVADFELMFSNARDYNEEDSQLHQDAIILIRLVKQWLRSRHREQQTTSNNTVQQTSRKEEPSLGGIPRQFHLGNVSYMVGSEVGLCLGMIRGELYKRYPNAPKRLASHEERRQLLAQGYSSGASQIMLLRADDVKQIMIQEGARKHTLSVSHTVNVPTVSENITWRLRFLPEQLLLHLAIPSHSVPSVVSMNARNEVKVKPSSESLHRQYCLLETLKACCDGNGRQVAALFIELPSRHEYPDYYQVIRKPIDINKIESRIRSQQYCNVDEMFTDIVLLCDNACRYNELGSEVFMDSTALLQLAVRMRAELMGVSYLDVYPSVDSDLHYLLCSLLQSIMCCKTETGRILSDSLIPLRDTSTTLWTLEDVSQLLDDGYYRQLDGFQRDVFVVLKHTRETHRLDSQAYEDAVLLQRVYMTERDRLCGGGLKWFSPALNYQLVQFQKEIAEEKQKKLEQEKIDDEQAGQNDKKEETEMKSAISEPLTEYCFGNVECHVGETVSFTCRCGGQSTDVLFLIQKIWKDESILFEGHRFYFAGDVVLQAERKFLDREVLLSHESEFVRVENVEKVCVVMTDKQYFTHQPKGLPPSSVYFCESTYNRRTQTIQTLKTWPVAALPAVDLELRETPLSLERKTVTERTGLTDSRKTSSSARIPNNIVHNDGSGEEGQVYYEQFCVNNVSYKTGDCVFVNTDKHHPCVARIDSIWTDANGDPWFHGPWFVHPFETDHLPTRMFYIHELLLSSNQDTNPLHSIVRKCAVLAFRDYIRCRPVGVAERDVFVCEVRYNEADQQIRKLKGLKKFSHSSEVVVDEFYYFDEEIHPLRIPSPFLFHDLQSLFGLPAESQQCVVPGFVHFANEVLPLVRQTQTSLSFPELLHRTAQQWDRLDDSVKHDYSEKSRYMIEPVDLNESVDVEEDNDFVCQWSGCNKQFTDSTKFTTHILSTAADSHIIMAKTSSFDFPCLWAGCSRIKRPFNQLTKIVRHVRDVHLKSVTLPQSTVASEPSSSLGSQSSQPATPADTVASSQQISSDNGPVERFVSPPPRQQIQHSNIYLKYVEQLRSGGRNAPASVCERTGESCLTERQLERQFLGAGRGSHESVIDALWALRNAMMLDALKLSNALDVNI